MTLLPYIVAATFFMEYLDATILATALPSMAKSFGVGPNDLSFGVTAYTLTLAVFIPISGWAADRFGSRTVYTCAVAIFALASMLCGISTSVAAFTAARALQGLGGALMVPVGRFIVVRNTPKLQMIRALSTITWPGIVAPVIGPTLGGFVIAFASWHWIFFINVPFSLICLFMILRFVPNQRDEPRKMDWSGFLTSGVALIGILLGTELASHTGASLPLAAALFVGGVALAAYTVRAALSKSSPLVDFRLMRHHTFRVTIIAGSMSRLSLEAMPYLLPLLLQIGFGLSPYHAGMLLIAFAAGNLAMKRFTTQIFTRFGFRRTAIVNGILCVVAILLAACLTPGVSLPILLTTLFACGLTRSLQFSMLATLAFSDLNDREKGAGSTLTSVTWQMGIGMGIALGALMLRASAGLHGEGAPSAFTPADFHVALAAIALPIALSVPFFVRLPRNAGHAIGGAGR